MLRELNAGEREFFIAMLSAMGMDGKCPLEAVPQFGSSGWRMVTIPDGAGMGKATFSDLAAVAKAVGDDELVISDVYAPQSHQHMVACPVDYYEFKQAISSNADYTTFDVCVVGRSGKWVAVLRGLDIGFFATDVKVLDSGELFGPGLRH